MSTEMPEPATLSPESSVLDESLPDGGVPALSGVGDVDLTALPKVRGGLPFVAEFWIALRHLMSRKSDAMISIVAVLAVVGVVVSVALVNIVTSVMTGFEEDLRDKILGANAHVVVLGVAGQVRDADRIVELSERIPGVQGAAPFVYGEVLLRSPSTNRYAGVIIKGIDPQRTDSVTSLADDLIVSPEGRLQTAEQRLALFRAMSEPTPGPTIPDMIAVRMLDEDDPFAWPVEDEAPDGAAPDGAAPDDGIELAPDPTPTDLGDPEPLPGILLGIELAKTLGVGPGSELQLMDPVGGAPGPMGMPTPRVKPVRVAGVYQSGMYEYDNKWTYMANPDVQSFMRLGDGVTGVEVALSHIYEAPQVAAELDEAMGPLYYARHWQQMNQGLFEALELERQVSSLVLFSTVVIAALLIVCVLIMMVLTKTREIAILRAMGASRWGVLRVFVLEGMLIGLVGSAGGTSLGLLGCLLLDRYGWPLDTDVYFLNTLPVVIDGWNFASIAVGAVLTCFAATLYPALSAALMEPVEGLRYE